MDEIPLNEMPAHCRALFEHLEACYLAIGYFGNAGVLVLPLLSECLITFYPHWDLNWEPSTSQPELPAQLQIVRVYTKTGIFL